MICKEFLFNGRLLSFYLEVTGEVGFEVDNHSYHLGLSPREGAAIIRAAVRYWEEEFLKDIPPNLILYCRPNKDSFYEKRVKLYKKLGFDFLSEEQKEVNRMTLLRRVRTKPENWTWFLLLANQITY